MTPTEMELRDQLEDMENQLADQAVMLTERDAALAEFERVDVARLRFVADRARGLADFLMDDPILPPIELDFTTPDDTEVTRKYTVAELFGSLAGMIEAALPEVAP